ncbi:DUF6527 family protein [Noviherbaspirillum autotrophicum]
MRGALSLNPKRRPRWTVEQNFWRCPTISPSTYQQNVCSCY